MSKDEIRYFVFLLVGAAGLIALDEYSIHELPTNLTPLTVLESTVVMLLIGFVAEAIYLVVSEIYSNSSEAAD